jgi:RHS repeat-associated protein
MEGIGLYDYGARWFDASLGRFTSPDTLIPNPGDPQAWDRYAAMNNNPVVFVDPSGHMAAKGTGGGGLDKKEYIQYILNNGEIVHPLQQTDTLPGLTDFRAQIRSPLDFRMATRTQICLAPPTTIGPWSGPHGDLDPLHPDYAALSGSFGLPGLPGFSTIATIDRYSNIYWGLGINIGKSYATGYSGAVTGGWIGGDSVDNYVPPENEVESFLTGLSINASAGVGPGAGVTWSPFASGYDNIAIEAGVYSPQIGVTAYWSWLVYDKR